MVSLTSHYLIGAEAVRKGVKLTLFNPSSGAWEDVLDSDYKSYFFVPFPLSQRDRETVEGLHAKTMVEEKRDLFTGQTVRVTKVEMDSPSDPRRSSERFEKAWEGEVPYILGCVYDRGLTFGAQHLIRGNKVKPVFEIPEGARREFEERFLDAKRADPAKYELQVHILPLFFPSGPLLEIFLAILANAL